MCAAVLILAALVQAGPTAGGDSVHAFLASWRAAWESRQIDRYISLYSRDFHGGGKDLEAWREHKAEVFQNASTISVETEQVSISEEGDRTSVRFLQHYRSDRYGDDEWKRLELVRQDGSWRILSEESGNEEEPQEQTAEPPSGGQADSSRAEAGDGQPTEPPLPTPTPRPLDAQTRRDLYERYLQLRNAALACSRPKDRKFPRPDRPADGSWCERFHPQGGGDCRFYAECARYEDEVYRFVIEQAQLPDIATLVRRCGNVDVDDLELVELYLTGRCPRFYR